MTIRTRFLAVGCISALMGFAACSGSSDRSTASGKNDTSKERETVTSVQPSDKVNQPDTEKQGSEKVTVQKQATRTITSEEKVPTVLEGKRKFDINRMGKDDFKALGFPPSVSDNIINYRDKHDGFKSVDELSQVPGVTSSMLAPVRGKLGLSQKQ